MHQDIKTKVPEKDAVKRQPECECCFLLLVLFHIMLSKLCMLDEQIRNICSIAKVQLSLGRFE